MTIARDRRSICVHSCFAYWPRYAAGICRHSSVGVKFASSSAARERGCVSRRQFITPGSGLPGTTNQRLPNLLLVIDRLFIQMNADYRGGFSMLRQLAGAMNKLLPGARAPVLSVVLLQGPLSQWYREACTEPESFNSLPRFNRIRELFWFFFSSSEMRPPRLARL